MSLPHISVKQAQLGAVSSDDLLRSEPDVFAFYERKNYQRALDVGANIGIHTILMAKRGWSVKAFEPDPRHFADLLENLHSNGVEAQCYMAALSTHDGQHEFVRVLGNTTANHLKGSRKFYGASETLTVPVMDCAPFFDWCDFAKIDCEGHEAALLKMLPGHVDVLVEIASPKNAMAIFKSTGRTMYSQKIGWGVVKTLSDLPKSPKEGMLFIGETWD